MSRVLSRSGWGRRRAPPREEALVSALSGQPSSALPEPGQLVMVRGSYWVVTDVVPDGLPHDVVSLRAPSPATLLRLSNVGDDALGREIEVFWQREPGATVAQKSTMPSVAPGDYDDLGHMSAFLDAIRWGSVASADIAALQAPFRSGVRIEDYQLDPVVRALRSPRTNLLIADDVGLGKTIEAGLVVQELLMRQRARRIMIVAPASLTTKWRDEMAEKFGLRFEIVDADAVKRLRREHGVASNPWRVWPLTIVSLQWLRGERAQRALEEVLEVDGQYPRYFDVLIVDEAHHLAPTGSGRYAVDTQQTRTVRRLSPHAEHRLFLTATPHNGYRNSFASLLELLDPQRFTRGAEPNPEALAEVMVRRVKDDITNPDGTPRFRARTTDRIEVAYTGTDKQAHALLSDYVAARRIGGARQQSAADMVTLLLKKRLFSSPSAFAETLRVHADTERGAASLKASDSDSDDVPEWLLEQAQAIEDDFASEDDKNAAEEALLGAAATAMSRADDRQRRALEELLAWASAHGQQPDAKALTLLDWLEDTLQPDGEWNDERVVLFTEYRATQAWLAELLTARGLGGDRLRLIYGGQDDDDRDRVKSAFQAPPDRDPVRILLATDAASEGIDLQRHCHRMVLVDIPFSPNRLEQRIGRLDRYGQEHDVQVYHFVGHGWENARPGSYENDLEFLSRIAQKVTTIREDLGKVNQLISTAVEDQMTGRAARVDLDGVSAAPTMSLYRFERAIREQIDTARTELNESREYLRISPDNAAHITHVALELAGQPPLQPNDAIPGTNWIGQRAGVWKAATVGLDDPLTGEERPITFDPDIAAAHPGDVVLAHLNHPLVANATRLLRAEVWGQAIGGSSSLHRAAVLRIPDDVTDGTLVVAAFARLVIAGADGVRLHEEVFAAGGKILDDGRRWERLTVGRLEGILNKALDGNQTVADTRAADHIAEQWTERWSERLTSAINARARERVTSLTRKLDERRTADIERTSTVLTNLQRQIREQLTEPAESQLELFDTADERDQYSADRRAWERRLAEIPDEIDRETTAINARYVAPSPYVFPAAVLICIPDSLAGGPR